jgi:glycosyltransferase involved in cell wall biosynthesis
MSAPDVAVVTPFPPPGERHGGWTGVASYSANLTQALTRAGARVVVIAEAGGADAPQDGALEVRRVWRRGPRALPQAAAAALRTKAPAVHLQHELFLYGGPAALPGLVPALAALRGRRSVVTMHHVVAPRAIDSAFTATHRVRAPAPVARAGVAAVQRTIRALAGAVVVHEPSFAATIPGATVVPHGIELPEAGAPPRARPAAGGRLQVLCFGHLAPYKGLETAIAAARLAGDAVRLVIAGGEHPRLAAAGDRYAERLRASAPPNVHFTGFVPDARVADAFAAADLALLPYPQPFASSGPLALALAHGTPALLSPALADTVGAPPVMAAGPDAAAIADRLRALADPGERDRLRAAGAALAVGRSWPEVARRHLVLYGVDA